jgi:hypothetical protein
MDVFENFHVQPPIIALPTASRRHSRLKICATARRKKFRPVISAEGAIYTRLGQRPRNTRTIQY